MYVFCIEREEDILISREITIGTVNANLSPFQALSNEEGAF